MACPNPLLLKLFALTWLDVGIDRLDGHRFDTRELVSVDARFEQTQSSRRPSRGSSCCVCAEGTVSWSESGACSGCRSVEKRLPVQQGCARGDKPFLGSLECANKCRDLVISAPVNRSTCCLCAEGKISWSVSGACSGCASVEKRRSAGKGCARGERPFLGSTQCVMKCKDSLTKDMKAHGSSCCLCVEGRISWSASGACSQCSSIERTAPAGKGCIQGKKPFLGNQECVSKCSDSFSTEASAMNEWSNVREPCADIVGTYMDNTKVTFEVTVSNVSADACNVHFTYGTKPMTGTLTGTKLKFDDELWSSGILLSNGEVQFEDVGYWAKVTGQKAIIFLRHGESMGNAGLDGVLEAGDVTAWKDGALTQKGKKQVEDRFALINQQMPELFHAIKTVDLVLVSPLLRAMMTAVLALAHAHQRDGKRNPRFPRIEVVNELREKVKSDSERPGKGLDPIKTVTDCAEQMGKRLFNNTRAMRSVVKAIRRTYQTEARRTTIEGKPWQPEPDDALKFVNMIRSFKASLRARPETNILLVGHSGWARFALSAFLPDARTDVDKENALQESLIYGERDIYPLMNAGVHVVNFEHGQFLPSMNASISRTTREIPGNEDLPVYKEKKAMGVFVSIRDAIHLGVVPASLPVFERFMCRIIYTLMSESALMTVSIPPAGRLAHLALSSMWGDPSSKIVISDRMASLRQHDARKFEITEFLESKDQSEKKGQTVWLQIMTNDDAIKFIDLFKRAGGHIDDGTEKRRMPGDPQLSPQPSRVAGLKRLQRTLRKSFGFVGPRKGNSKGSSSSDSESNNGSSYGSSDMSKTLALNPTTSIRTSVLPTNQAPAQVPTQLPQAKCCKCSSKSGKGSMVYSCSRDGKCAPCRSSDSRRHAKSIPAAGLCADSAGTDKERVKACKIAFER